MKTNLSIEGRLLASVLITAALMVCFIVALSQLQLDDRLKYTVAFLFSIGLGWILAKLLVGNFTARLKALHNGMLTFKDNDYSISILSTYRDELGQVIALYNEVGTALRQERQHLYQRELLLETVIQNSASNLVLTDYKDRIIYANHSSQKMFNAGKAIIGKTFSELLNNVPDPLHEAIAQGKFGLLNMEIDGEQQTYHLARGQFVLNTLPHHLYLIKQMTRELNREEVRIWKKVIRLISHELNNSLAPISSVAHSGQLMIEKQKYEQLPQVFESIAERAKHLKTFIDDYVRLAKLPIPNKEPVQWEPFIDTLNTSMPFQMLSDLPSSPGNFDPVQIEQALLNILKNAHESGSPADKVAMRIIEHKQVHQIEVVDSGPGMSDKVLQNALLPFYSTKTRGSGVGLPLCREIIEAHDGKLNISNRKDGGLKITIWLPRDPALQKENGLY